MQDVERKEIAKYGDYRVYRVIEKVVTIFVVSYESESEIEAYMTDNATWYLIPPSLYHTNDFDKVFEIPLMITK